MLEGQYASLRSHPHARTGFRAYDNKSGNFVLYIGVTAPCLTRNLSRRALTPALVSALVLPCCHAVVVLRCRAAALSWWCAGAQASDASSVAESGAVDTSEGALESDFQKRMDDSWVRIRRLRSRDVRYT